MPWDKEEDAIANNFNGFLQEPVERRGRDPDPLISSKTFPSHYIDFAQPCLLILRERATLHSFTVVDWFTRSKITICVASAIKRDVFAFERIGDKFARIHNEVAMVFTSLVGRKRRVSVGRGGL